MPTLPLGAQGQSQAPRHWAWQCLQVRPAAHHPMAALPPPTCLYKHLGTLPTVTQRRLCPFPGVKLPQLRGLFLPTPTYLPSPQCPDLCPPSLKPALPRTLWCRCADTVPCHPLSCKRDQEGSKQPPRGQVLCWERTSYTHRGTGLSEPTWPGQWQS